MAERKISPYASPLGIIIGAMGIVEVMLAYVSEKPYLFLASAFFGLAAIRAGKETDTEAAIAMGSVAVATTVVATTVFFLV